jgi:N-acetylglucosamine kinase-like BadF-type ATPase
VRFPALAELSGDFAPGGAWLGLRALGLALRAGDGRGPATALRSRVSAHLGTPDPEAALTGLYTGVIPYARLFELARVLLDTAAEGDGPARGAADTLADEIVAFVRAAIVRLDLQNEGVEVVLGGGIFDTTDAAFHARVAAGIRAVAPRATLVRLDGPPVLGAALIGLDAEGVPTSSVTALRRGLEDAAAGAGAGAGAG